MKVRRLDSTALEKVWGTQDTEPWYPRGSAKTGEVWFVAPEEPRLLIKFLFTSEALSVQVHPGDSASGPGKTEMWRVLRSGPGARLALGFNRPLDRDEARAAALSGEIEHLLHWYAAKPGDTFFVPAGTVHAIGPDLALCEIQQNSDVTYRLYDYGRPRELHLDEALAVAQLGPYAGPSQSADLVECPYFRTESIKLIQTEIWPSPPQPEFLICLKGEGRLAEEPYKPGQVWIFPKKADAFQIEPQSKSEFLKVQVP